MSKNTEFWNIRNVLSRQALFNFIISFRGGGKTFGCKKYAIDNFLKTGEQFIYLRRYETDLEKAKKEFLTDLIIKFPKLFQEHKIIIKGDKLFIDEKTAGFFIPLSKAGSYKSTAFPNVTLIIYDEFLIDRDSFQKYIPREPYKFNDFYSTVARVGTGHPDVIVFFLGNAISLINPYFSAYNISLPYKKDIKLFANNEILVQIFNSPELQEKQAKSRFGQIMKATNKDYFNYAFNGNFNDNNREFVKKKDFNYKFYFTFVYNNKYFGVWSDYNNSQFIISYDYVKTFPLIFACSYQDMQPNFIMINKLKKSTHWQNLFHAFNTGQLYFENVDIKNNVYDLFSKIL